MFIWNRKWGLVRLALAVFVCWVLAADTGARLARLQLASLPDFDYVGEVRALRAEGRYGEAVVIAQAGLGSEGDGAETDGMEAGTKDEKVRAELQREMEITIAERDSWMRKARAAGWGAVTGRGDSLEALVGAVAADFFLVGDVRDLVIEGGKQIVDGESDQLVMLLSLAGVLTTVAPEIDWAPSIIKAARRSGKLGEGLAGSLRTSLKGRDTAKVAEMFEDVARISKKASPGGAMRTLALAESPADLKRLAKFVESQPAGAFALHVMGDQGAAILKSADEVGEVASTGLKSGVKSGVKGSVKATEDVVVAAAKKGNAGKRFLGTPAGRALLKPHPLIGLAKAFWKGNAEKLITRLVDRLDVLTWWLLPLSGAWAFFECVLLVKKRGKERG